MPKTTHFRLLHQGRIAGRLSVHAAVACPANLPAWVRQAVAVAWPAIQPFKQHQGPWTVAVQIASGPAIQAANAQFRQKSYVPDVLTFPLWENAYAGDIMLGWPKVVADARTQGKPLKAHVQHLIIHSLLHLAGFDHQTPATAAKMEAQEIAILKTLGWPNPYIIG